MHVGCLSLIVDGLQNISFWSGGEGDGDEGAPVERAHDLSQVMKVCSNAQPF
jgi:hypothetical protein